VAVFGHRGIRVLFFQCCPIGRPLFFCSINTRTAAEEKFLHVRLPRGHEQMCVNQDREHAQRFVVLDKAHSAHVGGEGVNGASAGIARRYRSSSRSRAKPVAKGATGKPPWRNMNATASSTSPLKNLTPRIC